MELTDRWLTHAEYKARFEQLCPDQAAHARVQGDFWSTMCPACGWSSLALAVELRWLLDRLEAEHARG